MSDEKSLEERENTMCKDILKALKKHVETFKCTVKEYKYRHPQICKWFTKEVGCKRPNCDFIHVTPAGYDGKSKAHTNRICDGCKNIFPDTNYVVNCKNKSKYYVSA